MAAKLAKNCVQGWLLNVFQVLLSVVVARVVQDLLEASQGLAALGAQQVRGCLLHPPLLLRFFQAKVSGVVRERPVVALVDVVPNGL